MGNQIPIATDAAAAAATEWRLGHRPALDGLRGVAILLVLGNHAAVPWFDQAGRVGVTMFFVLSGFLITRVLVEERQRTGLSDLGTFYWHRAVRLLPALAAMIVFAVPLLAITAPETGPVGVLPGLFYVSNFVQIGASADTPVVGHTWSLSVEEQFYVLWPLLMLGLLRLRTSWAVMCGIATMAAAAFAAERVLLWEPTREAFYRTHYGTDTNASALLLGCGLAALFAFRPVRPPGMLAIASVAGLALVIPIPSLGFNMTIGLAVATVTTAVLIAWAAHSNAGVLSSGVLGRIGVLSYALYLWHLPMLHAARAVVGSGPIASATGLSLTLVAAVASRRWIELPTSRWRDARGRRRAEARRGALRV